MNLQQLNKTQTKEGTTENKKQTQNKNEFTR